MMVIAVIIGIPFFLLGFSIPVMAWWAISRERLGLLTKERDAETWLFLGMLSAFPAILINSFLFPSIVGLFGIEMSEEALMNLTAIISAPIGEEICKGLAVAAFMRTMNGSKRGFQIGFTVGLGFALIENLQYVLISFGGGFTGFALTSLIRGIGSIPGHAFWTGMTGFAIGIMASKNEELLKEDLKDTTKQVWKLFDPDTGQEIQNGNTSAKNTLLPSIDEQPHDWYTLPPSIVVPKMEKIGKGIRPPSNVGTALIAAMAGHALWNCTAVATPWFTLTTTGSEGLAILASLLSTIILVIGVLTLGNSLLDGVHDEEEKARF